jgi:hypothetical protein
LHQLREEVAGLREEVAELRKEVAELRKPAEFLTRLLVRSEEDGSSSQ